MNINLSRSLDNQIVQTEIESEKERKSIMEDKPSDKMDENNKQEEESVVQMDKRVNSSRWNSSKTSRKFRSKDYRSNAKKGRKFNKIDSKIRKQRAKAPRIKKGCNCATNCNCKCVNCACYRPKIGGVGNPMAAIIKGKKQNKKKGKPNKPSSSPPPAVAVKTPKIKEPIKTKKVPKIEPNPSPKPIAPPPKLSGGQAIPRPTPKQPTPRPPTPRQPVPRPPSPRQSTNQSIPQVNPTPKASAGKVKTATDGIQPQSRKRKLLSEVYDPVHLANDMALLKGIRLQCKKRKVQQTNSPNPPPNNKMPMMNKARRQVKKIKLRPRRNPNPRTARDTLMLNRGKHLGKKKRLLHQGIGNAVKKIKIIRKQVKPRKMQPKLPNKRRQ